MPAAHPMRAVLPVVVVGIIGAALTVLTSAEAQDRGGVQRPRYQDGDRPWTGDPLPWHSPQPVPSRGQHQALCEHFGRVAAAQLQSAVRAGCTMRGERWSRGPAAHESWCAGMPAEAVREETITRERELAHCLAEAARTDADCRNYAEEAIGQFEAATRDRCGVAADNRWHASAQRHHAWCRAARPEERRAEVAARAVELDRCRAGATERRACENYAEEARRQAASAADKSCGFEGTRWSVRADDHYSWCLKAPAAQRLAEAKARADDLKLCVGGGGGAVRCARYAERAVRLNDINEERGCELRGATRWNSSYDSHYGFCRASDEANSRAEERARMESLRVCARDKGFKLDENLTQ